MMKTFLIIFSCLYAVSAHIDEPWRVELPITSFSLLPVQSSIPLTRRFKRDAVGALDIVTNNAQPIHADVKIENEIGEAQAVTEKPCPKPYKPSPIEMGTVFQNNAESSVTTVESASPQVGVNNSSVASNSSVTAPKDVTTIPFQSQSLRKSWPLGSRLDLIRSVSRILTLTVLVISAVFEFYPLIQHVMALF